MDNIFEQFNKTGYLHHAYVIEGIHENIVPQLISDIERNLNIAAKNNPDFTVARHDAFSIDEARILKDVQTRAAWSGTRKIFVISASSFSHEAQNALLKTFEEPTLGTHFFIVIPRAESLLPTLRSRVLIVQSQKGATDDVSKAFAVKFVDATLENRFAMIKKLAEKKAGDTVDRELFRRILDEIEILLHSRGKGKQLPTSSKIFNEIHDAKNYLATRGASPKMLLEQIAMAI